MGSFGKNQNSYCFCSKILGITYNFEKIVLFCLQPKNVKSISMGQRVLDTNAGKQLLS
jgi:hypothetical protein